MNDISSVRAGERRGLVMRKTLGHYTVQVEDKTVLCEISSLLRRELIYPISKSLRPIVVATRDIRQVDPVAVGDWVTFVPSDEGRGIITDVLPRKSRLSRLAPGQKPLEQVVVANPDLVVPVFSAAKPSPKWAMLDRYLVSAEAAGLDSLIVVTKSDLVDESDIRRELDVYEKIGYQVVLSSAVSGEGTDAVREALKGRLSVFVGKSGVGKTSLLNAIQPELGLRVQEVSGSTGKGKHTTTHLEMFPLEFGGHVVDTPGMREFGLWNVKGAAFVQLEDDEASSGHGRMENRRGVSFAWLFPDLRPHLDGCKFGADCTHTHEPDCSIKAAIRRGEIARSRYQSYEKLAREWAKG